VGLPRDRLTLLGLKELDLSWHNLSELPEQLQYLKQLKCLRVQKCRDGLQHPFIKMLMDPMRSKIYPIGLVHFLN